MDQPVAGAHLARITSVTVFIPHEKPLRFKAAEILAAGMQGGTSVCAVRDPKTEQITEYIGLPLKIEKEQPSGLVAPGRSGGVIIPPT